MTTAPELLLPLLLFVCIATLSPGGATALATASGSQFGFRRSLPLIAGIALGLATLAAAAAAGLAGVFLALPSFQMVLRGAGSAYLLWLAWKIARSGRPNLTSKTKKPLTFASGVMLLWLNPKGWTMTLSAAATFATLATSPAELAALLGVTFGVFATLSLSVWCVTGLLLARVLRTDQQWRLTNAVLGLLLAASIAPIWMQ
jgi:threonine/homoserine/homoserine lactone efflux protein